MRRPPTSSTERAARAARAGRLLVPLAVALAVLAASGCRGSTTAAALSDKAKRQWEAGHYQDAARNFVAVAELYPNDPLVEESLYWAANLYEQYLKDSAQAIRYFQELLSRFPHGAYRVEAAQDLAEVFEAEKSTQHRALQLYQQLLQSSSSPEQRDNYQFKVAQLNLQMGKLDQARFEFRTLITKFPKSTHLAEAYYLVGYSYYLEKRYPLAVAVFKRTDEKFAGTPVAEQARYFVADTLEEQGKMREALTVFRSLQGHYHNERILTKRIATLESRLQRSVR